jgi:hypothetical protein
MSGVTPDLEIPYNNFFERWYPHPDRLTACSIEDCTVLERVFPGLTFRLTKGDRLPFGDREFDLAVSFAVVEHVGSRERQRQFVSELARVARSFVLYTPNRYFPVEMHTLLPLTHWLPTTCYRPLWRRLGLAFWGDEGEPEPPIEGRCRPAGAGLGFMPDWVPMDGWVALEHRGVLATRPVAARDNDGVRSGVESSR